MNIIICIYYILIYLCIYNTNPVSSVNTNLDLPADMGWYKYGLGLSLNLIDMSIVNRNSPEHHRDQSQPPPPSPSQSLYISLLPPPSPSSSPSPYPSHLLPSSFPLSSSTSLPTTLTLSLNDWIVWSLPSPLSGPQTQTWQYHLSGATKQCFNCRGVVGFIEEIDGWGRR